ncbi:hypothetical protein AWB94_05160 [Mycolicibacterium canariasense]|nr:hypothetical protein AWB94_05160 [Mycolicibacterium canariasense]
MKYIQYVLDRCLSVVCVDRRIIRGLYFSDETLRLMNILYDCVLGHFDHSAYMIMPCGGGNQLFLFCDEFGGILTCFTVGCVRGAATPHSAVKSLAAFMDPRFKCFESQFLKSATAFGGCCVETILIDVRPAGRFKQSVDVGTTRLPNNHQLLPKYIASAENDARRVQ